MENMNVAPNPQAERDTRKAEQAKNDRRRARKAKLMPLLRLGGIVLGIVVVIGGLIWIGETQDSQAPQPSPISGGVSDIDHVEGSETARVTLIEYADFQCPTCKAYAPVLDQLLSQYPDDVRIAYRYFPLQSIHENATISAQAAEAAGLQGKFWEMHDLLFERQSAWSTENNPTDTFVGYAQELGLNADQFRSDLESKDVKNRVNADYKSGLSAGVQGTPTFYMNGQPLDNPRGLEAFEAVINEQLQ